MDFREQLALWYLRLNGYFTMPNFVAHAHNGARTDVDVFGIRFPHSAEFEDDRLRLQFSERKVDIVLAEVKAGECRLNGPWKGKSTVQPLEYVLKRVGVFAEPAMIDRAASELYKRRQFPPVAESDRWPFVVRILCFGQSINTKLDGVTQILWPDVISFIGNRFQGYAVEKSDHNHWDSFGKFLWSQLADGTVPTVDQLATNWKATCPCWP
jgi:hypothetical protein